MPVELDTFSYLKAITLRITEIQPAGAIFIYSTPFRGMPVRFDQEHPEQRIETTDRVIWTQLQDGAETFRLELVNAERAPLNN